MKYPQQTIVMRHSQFYTGAGWSMSYHDAYLYTVETGVQRACAMQADCIVGYGTPQAHKLVASVNEG